MHLFSKTSDRNIYKLHRAEFLAYSKKKANKNTNS